MLGPGVSYGLLHGRLSAEEKADALAAFAAGRTNVLIATTVVEVSGTLQSTACSVPVQALVLPRALVGQERPSLGADMCCGPKGMVSKGRES